MSGVLSSVNVAGFMEPEGGGISILGTDLLKDRCVVEKDCFAPQIISFEVPDDDCSHLHRLPSWWPCENGRQSPRRAASGPWLAQEWQPTGKPWQCPALRRPHSIWYTLQRSGHAQRPMPDARRP
jgi:hypothetical protein